MKHIRKIVSAEKVNMGGIVLDQALPVMEIDQIDPFLLIHHWHQHYEPGNNQKDLGVGPHPHRGFSPVTFIFKGGLQHRDSRGYNSVVFSGGTQWINSGMGLIHSERPAKEIAENGGELELIQFWINLPARHKMDQPSYTPLRQEETPRFLSDDGKVSIGVVAGEFMGISGGIDPLTPMLILRMGLEKSGNIQLPVAENFNTLLYLLDGKLEVGNQQIGARKLAWFENSDAQIEIKAVEDSRAILLAGQPIGEPVVASGPFVMNTDTEILEAMRDYRMGKMGHLVEEF